MKAWHSKSKDRVREPVGHLQLPSDSTQPSRGPALRPAPPDASVPDWLPSVRPDWPCRAPRFLTHVRDEMGDLSEVVVHKLLEHGRLR